MKANTLFSRTGYRVLAYVSFALALAGVVLPLLPTTPFILLAAWSASRSSPAFSDWLEKHRHFGPMIEGWRTRRAVPASAKVLATTMMFASWLMLWLAGATPVLLITLGVFFAGLLAFLWSRPSR